MRLLLNNREERVALRILLVLSVFIVTMQKNLAQTPKNLSNFPKLDVPQITGDFTLRYNVKEMISNSPDAFKANNQPIDDAILSGVITQEDGEAEKARLIAHLNSQNNINNYSIIISRHTGILVVKINNKIQETSLFDGTNTYFYIGNIDQMEVHPGFDFSYFQEMPCPGASLPGLPLIKLAVTGAYGLQLRGDVFTGVGDQNGPYYLPGVLTFRTRPGASPMISGLEWFQKGKIRAKNEFSGQANVRGVQVASRIRDFRYYAGTAKPVLGHTFVFTLVSASDKPLPDEQFSPSSYLHAAPHDRSGYPLGKGTVVKWERKGKTSYFRYLTGTSFEQQLDQSLKFEENQEDAIKISKNRRRGPTGPILLTGLLAIGAWWLVRRRRIAST